MVLAMVMVRASLLLTIVLPLQGPTNRDAGDLVRQATAAVEGDSVTSVARRWHARMQRDSSDRPALLGLATLARLTYDYARADSLYNRLLSRKPDAPDRLIVLARVGRGLSMRFRGLHRDAEDEFARAVIDARSIGDSALEAEALVLQAQTRVRTRGPTAADSLFQQAGALISTADYRVRALYHCGRGERLTLTSDAQAMNEGLSGAELARRAGDRRSRAICLTIVATDLQRRNLVDSAITVYGDVISELRAARHTVGLAGALQRRGYMNLTIGAYDRARRDLEEAVTQGQGSGNTSAAAWALNNLGLLAHAVGDIPSAAMFAARADTLFAVSNDRYGALSTRTLEALVAFTIGDVTRARSMYLDVLRQASQFGFATNIVETHVSLAHLAMREGKWREAERELANARTEARARQLSGVLEGLNYHFAALALRRGRLSEAEQILRGELASVPEWQGDSRYEYAARLAEVYARRGELVRAQLELKAAFDAFDSWWQRLDDRRLRLVAFQASDDISDPDLQVATIIAALAAHGGVEPAFVLAERLRARELLNRLVRAEALRSGGSGPYDSLPRNAPSATAVEIRAALPDDSTALLEFVTGQGGEPTTLFVVARGGDAAFVVAEDDSLAPMIARFRA